MRYLNMKVLINACRFLPAYAKTVLWTFTMFPGAIHKINLEKKYPKYNTFFLIRAAFLKCSPLSLYALFCCSVWSWRNQVSWPWESQLIRSYKCLRTTQKSSFQNASWTTSRCFVSCLWILIDCPQLAARGWLLYNGAQVCKTNRQNERRLRWSSRKFGWTDKCVSV